MNYDIISFVDKKKYNLSEFIFLNYYWILTLGAIIGLLTNQYWVADTLIGLFIYFVVFTNNKVRIAVNVFDLLWLMCFIWAIFTMLVNTYPNQLMLIIRCFSEQLAYMMAYWVVRKDPKLNVRNVIHAGYLPLLITSLLGIYLYVYEPAWYASRTKDFTTDFEEFEFKRLRSIFSDGYIIMYFIGITLTYEFFLLASGKLAGQKEKIWGKVRHKSTTMHYVLILSCIFALFLGIQRSVIASVFISLILAIFYAAKYSRLKNLRPIIVIGLIGIGISAYSILKMDLYQQTFYLDKIVSMTDDSQSLAAERLTLNKRQASFGLMGDGCGRHNMYADKYNPNTSMRDGEYMKLLTEQGYMGAFLLGTMVLLALAKSFKNYQYLGFEFAILIFLLICMVGANPLSTNDKHPLLYWIILGEISNFKRKNV